MRCQNRNIVTDIVSGQNTVPCPGIPVENRFQFRSLPLSGRKYERIIVFHKPGRWRSREYRRWHNSLAMITSLLSAGAVRVGQGPSDEVTEAFGQRGVPGGRPPG